MRAYDIIRKKRDGKKLSAEEIEFMVKGFTQGELPDYQMASWLMAIFFRGMDAEETSSLTMAMAKSGELLDLSAIDGIKVDKHSTGGVADTTTLVLGPLVAAAGVPVAKMSGRGLGHTGGTIDKLESIPGMQVEISREEFIRQVNRVKLAVVGQSESLAPADKLIYALRDVTATVESVPLIASSIMSKKIAAGADAIVLDVKCGNGAFMKTYEDAVKLAEAMVAIGRQVGRPTVAVITDMNQPLGNAIGNALEVREAIETLNGRGPADLVEVCFTLGARMLMLAGQAADPREGREALREILASGKGLEKFREFVQAQGGDPAVVDDPERLPRAAFSEPVRAREGGFVQAIATEALGIAAWQLGAGRARKGDAIDLAVGIRVEKRLGQMVEAGEPLATLFANDPARLEVARRDVSDAFTIGRAAVEVPPLVKGVIS